MYPTLTDLLFDLFGVRIPLPIQTYGLFVALAFLVDVFVLSSELKRKEALGQVKATKRKIIVGEPAKITDLLISFATGFVLGFKLLEAVLHYNDFVASPQQFVLSWRGNVLGGLLLGGIMVYLKYREKNKERLPKPLTKEITVRPHEHTGNIIIIAAIWGIIGSKIFHNLENLDEFLDDPIGSIFSFSGLSFYGGLIVAAIMVVRYGKRNGIKILHLLDMCMLGVAMGYGIGRLGCHFSGDGCWGIPNTAPKPDFLPQWAWAYTYPNNVIREGVAIPDCVGNYCHALPTPVFPTSLYESLALLLVFGVLWMLRTRVNIPGVIASLYLILGGIERFLMEQIRVNNQLFGTSITQAEIIATCSFLLGAGILFWVLRNREKLKMY